MLIRPPRAGRQAGMGLVELLISMTLGLVLAVGGTSMYLGTAKSNAHLLKTAILEQELHAVMDLMLRDLRRAGIHGRPEQRSVGGANPFALDTASAYTGEAAGSCLTFTYDLDQDGTLDTGTADERFGYRLRAHTVEIRNNGLACAAGAWQPLTDAARTHVTALSFSVRAVSAGAMQVRAVRIQLSGHPVGDATTVRNVVREVHVRNDRYAP